MHHVRPSAPFYIRDYVSVQTAHTHTVSYQSFATVSSMNSRTLAYIGSPFFFRFLMQHGTKTISIYNSAAIPKHILKGTAIFTQLPCYIYVTLDGIDMYAVVYLGQFALGRPANLPLLFLL